MKKFVIDASTSLKWVFEETDSGSARKILQDYQQGKVLLVSPDIWTYEVANAINSTILRKKVARKRGNKILSGLMECKPETLNMDEDISRCLDNAIRYKISVYDSAYVTLSLVSRIPYISSDTKLIAKLKTSSCRTLTPAEYTPA